ncbi:ABC transporter substrate-binding protein, partial [Paenibacillus sp. TAF58]
PEYTVKTETLETKGRKMPNIYQVQEIGRQQFTNVLQGKTTVREALKHWQTQGDAMLIQMKENPSQPPQPMMQAIPAG